MARRKNPAESGFLFCDVVYQDGSLSSNRRIAASDIDQIDRTASVRALLEAQDRKIAEASGKSRGPIKSVTLHAGDGSKRVAI